jgi:hypothetical protein
VNPIIEAAQAWYLSKRPSHFDAAQHKQHPWVNTFGDQETMLAVACAGGPEDCIIAAARAWYRSEHRPATIEGKHLDQVLSTMSSDDDDNQEGAIMNCWLVSLPGRCRRFVASQADAREMRELFMQEYSVKKKEVVVEPADIPTKKDDLLAYMNEAYATIDAVGVQ